MKKIIIGLLIIVGFLPLMVNAIVLPEKSDHEKVTIYIFRGHGCSHCYDALEYFYKNREKYADYFDVVTYEVWENEANSKFMKTVADALEDEVTGVPYMVIGDAYTNKRGFSDELSEEIVNAALAAYQDDNYVDLVGNLAKDNDKIESKNLEESCRSEGIIAGKYDTLIIFSILLVVIGGGVFLIKMARK
ncbi:MAG: hypothetical protein IKR74_00775 [Bacilli bacterium]|nr:hypothetical protein [Bacilli bacterium]